MFYAYAMVVLKNRYSHLFGAIPSSLNLFLPFLKEQVRSAKFLINHLSFVRAVGHSMFDGHTIKIQTFSITVCIFVNRKMHLNNKYRLCNVVCRWTRSKTRNALDCPIPLPLSNGAFDSCPFPIETFRSVSLQRRFSKTAWKPYDVTFIPLLLFFFVVLFHKVLFWWFSSRQICRLVCTRVHRSPVSIPSRTHDDAVWTWNSHACDAG